MKFKKIRTSLLSGAFIAVINSAHAVPNINLCTRMLINAQPELLFTETQSAYEKSLSAILSELRPALAANIVNNPGDVCHILRINIDEVSDDVINMYIDHMNAYLYAVTVTKDDITQYYGDKVFLEPIVAASKKTFQIEYNTYTDKFINERSAQKLGLEIQNRNNDLDHAKKIFFNALTILEASKMPSVEAAMTNINLWDTDGTSNMLMAKKNYLQQYKCSKWQTTQGQPTAGIKYTYLTNNSDILNDGIKAAYELTSWYTAAGTSARNQMSYITPSYAPQGSRNIDIGAHPCTR